jgi:16S rRNA (cytosine1402-N4)-methyltransferase
VLSYHSLEDRQVKWLVRCGRVDGVVLKDRFGNVLSPWTTSDGLKRPISASEAEQEENRRARSVKMRVGVRTSFQPNSAWIRASQGEP